MNNLDEIIIAKYISSQLSEEEKNSFEKMLLEKPKLKKELNKSMSIWKRSSELGKKENSIILIPDIKEQLVIMNTRIDQHPSSINKTFKIVKSNNRFNIVYKLVAAVSFLLLASWGLYFVINQKNDLTTISLSHINTNNKEIREIKLSDGTVVWLNENSQFSYPKNFGTETRNVKLKGEAFFEVTKNPLKPFTIETQTTQTKILGTSFNLKTKTNKVQLALMTGIAFFYAKNETPIEVRPNQLITFSKTTNKISKQNISTNDFAAWRNKTIFFKNAPLHEVAQSLEKWYGVKIQLENKELNKIRFTAPCQNKSFDQILALIKETTGINYAKKNELILLSN